MKQSFLKFLAYCCVGIFLFFVCKYFLLGLSSQPTEGDSLHIHIPIAKAILHGSIVYPDKIHLIDYPAASELILALFIFFHIPLNIYNVCSLSVLFFVLYLVGKRFDFSSSYAMIFASAVCTLYGILRYSNTQKIDIWLLIFFALSLFFLQKPQKSLRYFFSLGLSLGMVIGSKYSGPFFALVVLIIYIKYLLSYITFARVIIFFIPCLVFGFSWYIRNYLNTGDPFYPQQFLFFKGDSSATTYVWQYWQAFLLYPKETINALVSEFMIWSVIPLIFLGIMCYQAIRRKFDGVKKIFLLLIFCIGVFLYLPPPPLHSYTSLVFGMRYGFPTICMLILFSFIFGKKYHQENILAAITFANSSFLLLPISYQPKLLFLFVPFIVLILFGMEKILDYFLAFKENNRGI